MADCGKRSISGTQLIENGMPLAEMRLFAGPGRRMSKDEPSRVVAECQRPGACLTTVACRNRVLVESLRRWVRRPVHGETSWGW